MTARTRATPVTAGQRTDCVSVRRPSEGLRTAVPVPRVTTTTRSVRPVPATLTALRRIRLASPSVSRRARRAVEVVVAVTFSVPARKTTGEPSVRSVRRDTTTSRTASVRI